MRTFEQTYPWISFRIELRNARPAFWMLLGEAASKCEHIAGVPLRPATAEQLHLLYLAKGAAATTAIEGNPLTEKEVLQHLQGETIAVVTLTADQVRPSSSREIAHVRDLAGKP